MSLREEMPQTAAFIDALRDAFGKEGIDASIRKGMQGVPGYFHANEAGREAGTAALPAPEGKEIDGRQMVLEAINPMNKEKAYDRGR